VFVASNRRFVRRHVGRRRRVPAGTRYAACEAFGKLGRRRFAARTGEDRSTGLAGSRNGIRGPTPFSLPAA